MLIAIFSKFCLLIQLIIPVEKLLFPIETDVEILEVFLKTLLCECFTPVQSPILYLMSVHHLNHALFRDSSPIKQKLLAAPLEGDSAQQKQQRATFQKLIRSVDKSQNIVLRNHLRDYSHYDPVAKYGLVFI